MITLSSLASDSLTGSIGSTGNIGATGSAGASGSQGIHGASGIRGASGLMGLLGSIGNTGASGVSLVGASGHVGASGVDAGSVGASGATGATGQTGSTGATGFTGFFGGAPGATASNTTWLNDVINVTLKPNPDGASGATGSYRAISPGIHDNIYIGIKCALLDATVLCSTAAGGVLGTIYFHKSTYASFPAGFANTIGSYAQLSVTGTKTIGNIAIACVPGDVIRVYTTGLASSENVTVAIRYQNT